MIEQALALVRSGHVIGIPTDTVYGIGADPKDPAAIEQIFAIKGRPWEQPIGLLVADLDAALGVVDLPDYARLWASIHWPGALNIVARPRDIWPRGVGDRDSLGVRVPDHPVALELLQAAGPLAVTSANRSGGGETHNDVEAASVLGNNVATYLTGESPGRVASTSVDVRQDQPLLLRQGPIDLGI